VKREGLYLNCENMEPNIKMVGVAKTGKKYQGIMARGMKQVANEERMDIK